MTAETKNNLNLLETERCINRMIQKYWLCVNNMFSVPITGDVEQKELVKLDRAGRAGQSWEIFTSVRIGIGSSFQIEVLSSFKSEYG